jgi:Holliday junction resolvase RusA-like endonuclease
MIELVISGRPVPLARPRMTKGRVYNSQSREMYTAFLELKAQWNHRPMFMDAVHMDLLFVFPISDSYSALKQRKLRNNPHIARVDLDNLCKYVFDCLIGVAFADDCIVASMTARKIYGDQARTEINIKKI